MNHKKIIESLSVKLFAIVAFILSVLLMLVGYYFLYNKPIIVAGIDISLVLVSVGSSIIGSLVFYLIYTRIAERNIIQSISLESAQIAVENAISLFNERFQRVIPQKIYPKTPTPTIEFKDDFSSLMSGSQFYWCKGDSASFAVYRINRLSQHRKFIGKDIVLIILDPRNNKLLEERAKHELFEKNIPNITSLDISKGIEDFRKRIYFSVIKLAEVSHLVPVDLYFHNESLFYRSEILEDGLFLSYYISGGDFPGSYLFLKDSDHYKVFIDNFKRNKELLSGTKISLRNFSDPNKLEELLYALGCDIPKQELYDFGNALFNRYDNSLPFSRDEFF